jgi:hypothetical protein
VVVSKEDSMLRLLLAFTPANLLHELGTGRALDNAGREREEITRTAAIVDALAGRLAVAVPEPAPAPPVAVARSAA